MSNRRARLAFCLAAAALPASATAQTEWWGVGESSCGPGPPGTRSHHPPACAHPRPGGRGSPFRPHFPRVRAMRTHRSPAATRPRSRHQPHHHSATPAPTSPNPPPAGGARQAACSGTAKDRPIAPSTRAMDAGSWIAASTRRIPEHLGQTNTSIPSARCSNSAQQYRRRPPPRLPPPCGTRSRARTRRSACCLWNAAAATFSTAFWTATAVAVDSCPATPSPAPCWQPPASPSSSRRGTTRERRPDAGANTPVIRHQVLPRLGNQRAQALHQHFLRHHQRRRAIAPTLLQRIPDAAVAQLHQPRLRNRRPRCVAAQLLQLLAIPC